MLKRLALVYAAVIRRRWPLAYFARLHVLVPAAIAVTILTVSVGHSLVVVRQESSLAELIGGKRVEQLIGALTVAREVLEVNSEELLDRLSAGPSRVASFEFPLREDRLAMLRPEEQAVYSAYRKLEDNLTQNGNEIVATVEATGLRSCQIQELVERFEVRCGGASVKLDGLGVRVLWIGFLAVLGFVVWFAAMSRDAGLLPRDPGAHWYFLPVLLGVAAVGAPLYGLWRGFLTAVGASEYPIRATVARLDFFITVSLLAVMTIVAVMAVSILRSGRGLGTGPIVGAALTVALVLLVATVAFSLNIAHVMAGVVVVGALLFVSAAQPEPDEASATGAAAFALLLAFCGCVIVQLGMFGEVVDRVAVLALGLASLVALTLAGLLTLP